MQKWEYTTLNVRDGIVLSANEQMIVEQSFWGGIKGGKGLHHFLSELGKNGWEVVGVSPISGSTGSYPNTVDVMVILKRPLL